MNAPRLFLVAALAALIVACGGGTGGTGATNTVSIGVMTKGSVILNGVHFSDTNATVVIDDTSRTAQIDTRDGMVVKLTGMVNGDGITGSAQQVRALVEVRGIPSSVDANANPQTLMVLNQTVFVDDQTIYSSLPSGFASIVANTTPIEVHGLRDSTGRIRATRIEANQAQMADAMVDEIRGVVSHANPTTNPTTFNLGSQAVNVANATIAPSNATYGNGSVVEVHCARPCVTGSAFQATVVRVEEAEDEAFQPQSGEQYEVEGLIAGFTSSTTPFFVAGISVILTSSTVFEGGLVTDLGNDVQVEAEGSFNGTTLVATKIEFKRSVIRLQGATTNATANSFDMQIANNTITVTVEVNSLTINGTIPVNGTLCVQVRGQRKVPTTTPVVVTAAEIDFCSNGDRNLIQAPVEAKSPVTSITLLGSLIGVSNPTPVFQGLNGPLTPTDFFNAITVAGVDAAGIPQPGTLVKVTFNSGLATVQEVEIEDEQ
jgi:uncharacterized protein DUF5666